jgi:DNA-binding MarR family transcriptional regulator
VIPRGGAQVSPDSPFLPQNGTPENLPEKKPKTLFRSAEPLCSITLESFRKLTKLIEEHMIPANATRTSEKTFRELIRLFGLLEKVMQPYFARFGISGSQWGVLRNLHRAEAEGLTGLRLTDLGDRLLIRPPSVTGIVDRLERVGLVVRDGAPEDLRAKLVSLTDKGRQLVGQVLAVHGEQIEKVLGCLNPAEQERLYRLLSRVGLRLESLLAGREVEDMP